MRAPRARALHTVPCCLPSSGVAHTIASVAGDLPGVGELDLQLAISRFRFRVHDSVTSASRGNYNYPWMKGACLAPLPKTTVESLYKMLTNVPIQVPEFSLESLAQRFKSEVARANDVTSAQFHDDLHHKASEPHASVKGIAPFLPCVRTGARASRSTHPCSRPIVLLSHTQGFRPTPGHEDTNGPEMDDHAHSPPAIPPGHRVGVGEPRRGQRLCQRRDSVPFKGLGPGRERSAAKGVPGKECREEGLAPFGGSQSSPPDGPPSPWLLGPARRVGPEFQVDPSKIPAASMDETVAAEGGEATLVWSPTEKLLELEGLSSYFR